MDATCVLFCAALFLFLFIPQRQTIERAYHGLQSRSSFRMGYRLQRLAPGGLVRLLLVRQLLRTVSERFIVWLDGW